MPATQSTMLCTDCQYCITVYYLRLPWKGIFLFIFIIINHEFISWSFFRNNGMRVTFFFFFFILIPLCFVSKLNTLIRQYIQFPYTYERIIWNARGVEFFYYYQMKIPVCLLLRRFVQATEKGIYTDGAYLSPCCTPYSAGIRNRRNCRRQPVKTYWFLSLGGANDDNDTHEIWNYVCI